MLYFQGISGLIIFIFIAWLLSDNKKLFPIRIVLTGILLQFLLAVLMLKLSAFDEILSVINKLFMMLASSTEYGTSFVFGYLGGANPPFKIEHSGSNFILAFRALPLILVTSALSSLLFYWKILPKIVKAFSYMLEYTMGIGGAEGLGLSANIFVGMVEAPLLIRPYLKNMTRSELFSVMVAGMSTIAGTVMLLYVSILQRMIPNILTHILTASIISIPAALLISKTMIPETSDITNADIEEESNIKSSMDAITFGTIQGLKLTLNIIAMLIVLVSLVHFVNLLFTFLPHFLGNPIKLETILGFLMAPVAWLMGITPSECLQAGSFLGTKVILNEFIAYLQLIYLPKGLLSPRTEIIMTYALCGFANLGSLGIMIAGLSTMVPEKRDEIISLSIKAIIAGTIATCMTGAVVGLLI